MAAGTIQLQKKIDKRIGFLVFANASSLRIPLEQALTNLFYASITINCANQRVYSTIATQASGDLIIKDYGEITIQAEVDGTDIVVTRPNGATFWGTTLVSVAANRPLSWGGNYKPFVLPSWNCHRRAA